MQFRTKFVLGSILVLLLMGTLFLTVIHNPSGLLRLASLVVSLRAEELKDESELQLEYQSRSYPTPAPLTTSLKKLVQITNAEVLGSRVLTLTPKNNASDWHIIYTHGGSFVSELVEPHWDIIEALIQETGATVTVPFYPLAPENDFQKTFPLLDSIYKEITKKWDPSKIIFCGDSAGANLALSETLRLRDQKLPLPKNVILFSPWVDLTMTNPEIPNVQPRDPMLFASEMEVFGKWWAGSEESKHPNLSPLYGDLSGLPTLHIYQGTEDILLPDARKLRDLAQAAGTKVLYYETQGGFHDFMGGTMIPEAKKVFQQIGMDLKNGQHDPLRGNSP